MGASRNVPIADLAIARWLRLGRPRGFILRVSLEKNHRDYACRVDGNKITIYTHQGGFVGQKIAA